MISISTAHYVLIQAFLNIKHQPLINTIVASLFLDRVPPVIKRSIEIYPEIQPATYKFKWMIRQPLHHTLTQYVQLHFNSNCFESFIDDKKYLCL